MTTPSNFVEIPLALFKRMLEALEESKPANLSRKEYVELLEDIDQWFPYEATDEEIDRSFDAYR